MTRPLFLERAPCAYPFGAYAVHPDRREYVGHGVAGLTLFHTRRGGVWNGVRIDPAAPAGEPWMRCTDVTREGTRTWRCQLTAGHQDRTGAATAHRSFSGHRTWIALPSSPLGGDGDAPGLADPPPCPAGATTQGDLT